MINSTTDNSLHKKDIDVNLAIETFEITKITNDKDIDHKDTTPKDQNDHQDHQHDHHHHHHHASGKKNMFIVIISLSAHSFFDGLILGTKTNSKDMWSFLFIIALHHSVMSFSVGCIINSISNTNADASVRDCSSNQSICKIITAATLWSVIIPFGISISLFQGHINKLAVGILIDVAVGSFLYSVFIELLPETINNVDITVPAQRFIFIIGLFNYTFI